MLRRLLPILVSLASLFALTAVAMAADAPAMRTIVLVRHGNYVEDPAIPEMPGPHLSTLGIAQARLAGARLAGEHFDELLVSPMQRARDTAAQIAPDFPGRAFTVVDDLAECTPPTWRVEITKDEKPAAMAACKARLDRVFASYFVPAKGHPEADLLVCHGNVIRYLVTRALKVDTKAWLEMSIGNASITTIRVESDGRFKVIAVGDVGHIPPNLRSGATGDADRPLEIP
ncbi:MAG: histidine phosphatase family protein [Proteobacteria bacterium]|nr:histidine phosphatase family protein [Pseudomonadota bacterium]